jgi:hypothetical protein
MSSFHAFILRLNLINDTNTLIALLQLTTDRL